MKNFLKYFILPFIVIGLAACTDLEEDLKGEITDDISIEGQGGGTDGGSSGPLAGVYSKLRDAGTANHGSYYSVQEITSDEMCIAAKGGDWYDGGILVQLHKHQYTPSHGFINNAWNGCYGGIAECNTKLGSGTLDENQTAQMRALRAYFYLRLVDLFGNVKIVTESNSDPAQSSRQEVFNFIESELLATLGISEVSSAMDVSGSALGTEVNAYAINRYAALGILAKLYLNAEVYTGTPMYDKAAAAAGYVIDSGVYQLCGAGCSVPNLGKRGGVASDPDDLEGYPAVFAPNNENNPENIWTVEYDEVTAGGMNFAMMSLHYSSQFTWNFDAQPWNGYATLEEFYNSYDANDVRKKHNFIVGPQLDFGGSAILDYAADDDDIQLNYTPAINELEPNSLREAGARPGKFSYKQLGRPDMDNDYPLIRLGELYLIRAEASARQSGNWNDALPDVNVIRARAGVSEYSSIDADEFLAERGREMYQESARRTDLIRFGAYGDAWWEKPTSEAYLALFPIPQDQITASAGSLSQNPGY